MSVDCRLFDTEISCSEAGCIWQLIDTTEDEDSMSSNNTDDYLDDTRRYLDVEGVCAGACMRIPKTFLLAGEMIPMTKEMPKYETVSETQRFILQQNCNTILSRLIYVSKWSWNVTEKSSILQKL